MKITRIEKKKRLYLLELDNDDKLYVTEDTIVHFMLSKDLEINQETLTSIKKYAQFSYGKNLALYHLSFKSRTRHEVKYYLQNHEIDSKTIPKILDNLQENKWIDDSKYAKNFISQNLHVGNKGPQTLKQQLRQKGISEDIINENIEQVDFSELAQKIAQKLYQKYSPKLANQLLKNKIQQHLIQKGFSYPQTKQALERIDIEKDDQQEDYLLQKELEKQYRKYSKKYSNYDLKQRLIQALYRKGFRFDDIDRALRDYLR